jgi:electron transfer flavoprotein alpha subunit
MDKFVVVIAETNRVQLTPASLECVEEGPRSRRSVGRTVQVILCGKRLRRWRKRWRRTARIRSRWWSMRRLAQFSADGWLQALAPVLLQAHPLLLLAPDSGQIRAWLPRLAVRWRMPLVGCCMRISIVGDGYPEIIRNTYGGACQERLIWPYATLVAPC